MSSPPVAPPNTPLLSKRPPATSTGIASPSPQLLIHLAGKVARGAVVMGLLLCGGVVVLLNEPPLMLLGFGLAAASLVLAVWWSRPFGAVLLVLGLGMPLLGAGYEAVGASQAAATYSPPGRLVGVGGHRLHLIASGSGGPTIVLEAGLGDTALTWSALHTQLAERTRVLSYDRAGIGFSEPGPVPRDAQQVAAELHALLAASGEPGPYLLVGHSVGGLFARVYAARYPGEVVGMVLLDPESDSLDLSGDMPTHIALRNLQRIGALRAFAPLLVGPLGMTDYEPYLPALITAHTFDTSIEEQRADALSQAESRVIATVGDVPVVVLSATGNGLSPEAAAIVRADQARYAAQSRRGALVEVATGHYVYRERPDLVVQAIESLMVGK